MIRLAALVLALLLPLPVAGQSLPKTKGWVEVQSPGLTLYSNAGERTTKKIAVDLERFRQILGSMTRGLEMESEVPTAVYVFKNDAALKPYKQGEDGETMSLSGYFLERPFRNYVAIDGSAGIEPRRVVYHEFVHSVLHTTFEYLPVWLDEGLAEYYSTFTFRGLTNTAEIGHLIPEHLLQLVQNGVMPSRELFAVQRGSSDYNEGSRQGRFYASAWLLVHYLAADRERQRHLNTLMNALAADPNTGRTTPLDSMGIDHDELDRRLAEYVGADSRHYLIELGEKLAEVPLESRTMTAGEVLFRLGDLLVQFGHWTGPSARAHLLAALEKGGPRARTFGALGELAEQEGKPKEAEKRYRQAAGEKPPDPEVMVRLAWFLMDRFIDEHPTIADVGETPAEVAEARALLRRSLELAPGHVDAMAVLGKTYLLGDEDPAEGISLLAQASSARPYRTDILHDLACMLAKSGAGGCRLGRRRVAASPEGGGPLDRRQRRGLDPRYRGRAGPEAGGCGRSRGGSRRGRSRRGIRPRRGSASADRGAEVPSRVGRGGAGRRHGRRRGCGAADGRPGERGEPAGAGRRAARSARHPGGPSRGVQRPAAL